MDQVSRSPTKVAGTGSSRRPNIWYVGPSCAGQMSNWKSSIPSVLQLLLPSVRITLYVCSGTSRATVGGGAGGGGVGAASPPPPPPPHATAVTANKIRVAARAADADRIGIKRRRRPASEFWETL